MEQADRSQVWTGRFEAQRASGVSIRAWCEREGVSEATFFYWRKRLSAPAQSTTQLIALPLPNGSGEPRLEIQTPDGYVIRIGSAAHCQWLPALLMALR
jgi:hypothetical protein